MTYDSGDWLYAQNRHGKYCVPRASAHRSAAHIVLGGGVWEPQTIEFLAKNAGDGDIVHAGAYFGDFLPALSRAVLPGRTLWTFEPNPSNFRAARETCRLNDLRNVQLSQFALGSQRETRQMRWKVGLVELGGVTSVIKSAGLFPESELIDVQVVPLDVIIPSDRKVTLIHFDVEGFEADVLSGAIKTITAWLPIVMIETCPQDWIDAHLRPLGYRPIGERNGNTILHAGNTMIA